MSDPRQTGLWPTLVSVSRGRTHGVAPHLAPLSVHTTLRGHEIYVTSQGRHAVEPGRLLILNAGQSARTVVPTGQATDSLSVLFSRALAKDVLRGATSTEEQLLDTPEDASATPPLFVERTYAIDATTALLLDGLVHRREGSSPDEALHALLLRLLVLHRGLRPEIARVPALRARTRIELFRRLSRARDFLDASLDAPVSTDSLARVACIAPHRLIRVFRETYGETPHRYAVRRRIERAARLLVTTDLPVAAVARAVGFESVGSFGMLFRRMRGVSPGRVRRKGNFRDA